MIEACAGLCTCYDTTVDCSGRRLSTVPQGIPANTTQLVLRDNLIPLLNVSYFADLPDLTHLDLSGNPLDTDPTAALPPALAARLQTLGMARLRLTAFDVFRASSFPALRELDMSGNVRVSMLRAGTFDGTCRLELLWLNDCAFTVDTLVQAGVGLLPFVTELDLSGNRLTSLPPVFLTNTLSLSNLRLSLNNISFVADTALRGAPNLQVLDLSRQTTSGSSVRNLQIPAAAQFVGLLALQVVRWTSPLCPAGTGLGLSDEEVGLFICLPCAPGSYLEAGGGSLSACRACPAGWTDHDGDPATPCVSCLGVFGVYTASGSVGACLERHACSVGTVDHDRNASTPCHGC